MTIRSSILPAFFLVAGILLAPDPLAAQADKAVKASAAALARQEAS